ncbi:hypothetical protein A9G28_00405 [Gilliamella sp. Fer1-1]|jgi:predicted MarR family transcription regulator|uniref:hypothetical protein n=1 Tax=unclassified Gilliamella TaxID=2685620 RepID=UPI00080DD741|nr:hypothetical protein [Gilliamella apicola]OCG17275.1 hypothetical protein A9G47_09175 [Gilliamella apicola]OCG44443.1 hypothetical protein A9G28_00405 [Gilliamella apicola]OCG71188.1 hypothetical protein A9G41_03295 [Gilliamella apicola]
MSNNKYFVIPRQISFDKELLNQVQKFVIDSPAANDELIVLSVQSKYYSIRDLMKILNISTIKEIKYLIKKLKLEQDNYRYLNSNKEWVYNSNALNILNLYLKFKAA